MIDTKSFLVGKDWAVRRSVATQAGLINQAIADTSQITFDQAFAHRCIQVLSCINNPTDRFSLLNNISAQGLLCEGVKPHSGKAK